MEHDFRLDVDELASLITPRTRVLVVNSPANPTGGVLTRGDLTRIAELAVEHDLWVLTDEIYGRILYDGAEHVSLASLPGHGRADHRPGRLLEDVRDDRLAAGLRGRAAIARPDLRPARHQHHLVCADVRPGRRGRGADRPAGRGRGDGRRVRAPARHIVDGLNEIPGIRCALPTGAFYVFPEVSGTGLSGAEFAERLLQEAGVCTLAGTAFGGVGTEHIRISLRRTPSSRSTRALARIRRFVAGLGVG